MECDLPAEVREVEREWRSSGGNEKAMFYSEVQTRPWAKKDIEAVNRKRREAARKKRDEEMRFEIAFAASNKQCMADLLDCWAPSTPSARLTFRITVSTTRPTSGASWRLFRLSMLGGSQSRTDIAIRLGITAANGMCAMTRNAPRSC